MHYKKLFILTYYVLLFANGKCMETVSNSLHSNAQSNISLITTDSNNNIHNSNGMMRIKKEIGLLRTTLNGLISEISKNKFFTRIPIKDINVKNSNFWADRIIIDPRKDNMGNIDFTKLLYAISALLQDNIHNLDCDINMNYKTNDNKISDNSLSQRLYSILFNLLEGQTHQQRLKTAIAIVGNSFKNGCCKNELIDQITKKNIQACKSDVLKNNVTKYNATMAQVLDNINGQIKTLVETITNELSNHNNNRIDGMLSFKNLTTNKQSNKTTLSTNYNSPIDKTKNIKNNIINDESGIKNLSKTASKCSAVFNMEEKQLDNHEKSKCLHSDNSENNPILKDKNISIIKKFQSSNSSNIKNLKHVNSMSLVGMTNLNHDNFINNSQDKETNNSIGNTNMQANHTTNITNSALNMQANNTANITDSTLNINSNNTANIIDSTLNINSNNTTKITAPTLNKPLSNIDSQPLKQKYTINIDLLNFVNNQSIRQLTNNNEMLRLIPELIKISIFQEAFLTSNYDNLYAYIMHLLQQYSTDIFKKSNYFKHIVQNDYYTNDLQYENEVKLGQFIAECINTQREKVSSAYLIEQIKTGAQNYKLTLKDVPLQKQFISKISINQIAQNLIGNILEKNLGDVGLYYWDSIALKSAVLKIKIDAGVIDKVEINNWIKDYCNMISLVSNTLYKLCKDKQKMKLSSIIHSTLIYPDSIDVLKQIIDKTSLNVTIPLLEKLKYAAPLIDKYLHDTLWDNELSFQELYISLIDALSKKLNIKDDIHQFIPLSKNDIDKIIAQSVDYPAQGINDISLILQIYNEASKKEKELKNTSAIKDEKNIDNIITNKISLNENTTKKSLISQLITNDNAPVILDFIMKNKQYLMQELDFAFYNYRRKIFPLTVYQLLNSLKEGTATYNNLNYCEFISRMKNDNMENLSFLYIDPQASIKNWNPEWVIDYRNMYIWDKNQFKTMKEGGGPKAVLDKNSISELWNYETRLNLTQAISKLWSDKYDLNNNYFYRNGAISSNIKLLLLQYDLWDIATSMNEVLSLISPNILSGDVKIEDSALNKITARLTKIVNILNSTDLQDYLKNNELNILIENLATESQQINTLKEQIDAMLHIQNTNDQPDLKNKQIEVSKKYRDILSDIASVTAPINCISNLYNSFWPKTLNISTFNINVTDSMSHIPQIKIVLDAKKKRISINDLNIFNNFKNEWLNNLKNLLHTKNSPSRNHIFASCNILIDNMQVGISTLKKFTDILAAELINQGTEI